MISLVIIIVVNSRRITIKTLTRKAKYLAIKLLTATAKIIIK